MPKADAIHNIRLIARLDIKGKNLIKSVQMEGIRVIGDPKEHARRYYEEGADEIIYMDSVASLYGRNNLHDIVSYTAGHLFVPLTVGGGLRSTEDVGKVLQAGADKVAINTAAVANPQLISDVASMFGSQCMVLSIEAKHVGSGWEVYTECGRQPTGRDAVAWAKEAVTRGAGEIMVTSIDREGTRTGFDVNLIKQISQIVPVPVIASGGMGSVEHMREVIVEGKADAVAMADILHYKRATLTSIRNDALKAGLNVRSLA